MNDQLTHLSIFTGIGGIDLAAERAGFRTIGQVEQNPYANRILRSRFGRKIPRWTDIRDLSAEDFVRRTGIDSPTLITGGFPCQPFSCAGKRRGKEDDRYLWPEMFRVVRELRPAWVLGENVAGIVSMELESCCTDLEGEGYTVRAFLIPACGVGALHRRERVFIVATNTRHLPRSTEQKREQDISKEPLTSSKGQLYSIVSNTNGPRTSPSGENRRVGGFGKSLADVANTSIERIGGLSIRFREPQQTKANTIRNGEDNSHPDSKRLQSTRIARTQGREDEGTIPTPARSNWWDVEPSVGRVAHGVPHRVDRLRCLGNAVVPQQVYPILVCIAQIKQEKISV